MAKPASTKRRRSRRNSDPTEGINPAAMGKAKTSRKSATEAAAGSLADLRAQRIHRSGELCAELAAIAKVLGAPRFATLQLLGHHLDNVGIVDPPVNGAEEQPKGMTPQAVEPEWIANQLVQLRAQIEQLQRLHTEIYDRVQRTEHRLRNHAHDAQGNAVERL